MPPPPVLQCDELRHLYEGERLTTLQIAARYGCSPTTAGNWLRRCGVVLRDSRYQAHPIPAGELEELYVVEGRPITFIAQRFGVSVGTIYNRLRAFKIASRKSGSRKAAEARAGYRWARSQQLSESSLLIVTLSEAKSLVSQGEMLRFAQHDIPKGICAGLH